MATRLLTVKDVAEVLRVSDAKVRGLIAEDELSASKIGRSWRVSQNDLDRYLERKKRTRPTHIRRAAGRR